LLQALTDNITRAVEGARLYSDIRRRADQLMMVAEVSKSVTSTLDLDLMMVEAANLIHEHFGYPHVYLFTVHPNRRLIEYEAVVVSGAGPWRAILFRSMNQPVSSPGWRDPVKRYWQMM